MKHLLFILLLPAFFACTPQGTQTIVGDWTVIEYYDQGLDQSSLINSSNNTITFGSDVIWTTTDGIDNYGLTQSGFMGNQNSYYIVDDVIFDYNGARFTIEWINTNKVKLVSLVHSGRHIIMIR